MLGCSGLFDKVPVHTPQVKGGQRTHCRLGVRVSCNECDAPAFKVFGGWFDDGHDGLPGVGEGWIIRQDKTDEKVCSGLGGLAATL